MYKKVNILTGVSWERADEKRSRWYRAGSRTGPLEAETGEIFITSRPNQDEQGLLVCLIGLVWVYGKNVKFIYNAFVVITLDIKLNFVKSI